MVDVPTTAAFNTLAAQIAALATRVTKLEAQVAAHEARITKLETGTPPPPTNTPSPDNTEASAPGQVLRSAAGHTYELATLAGLTPFSVKFDGHDDRATHDGKSLVAMGGKIYQRAASGVYRGDDVLGGWTFMPNGVPGSQPPPGPDPEPVPPGAELFGIYQGGGKSEQLAVWNAWAGHAPDMILDFASFDTKQEMINSGTWLLGQWPQVGIKRISLRVGLATHDCTQAQAAAGGMDDVWRQLAQASLTHGYTQIDITPGWEFNGGWYPWEAKHASNPDRSNEAEFAAVFRRCVEVFRAVSATAFRFCWNPTINNSWGSDADKAYPGDDVVDLIGLDAYADTWDMPAGAPTDPATVWQKMLNGGTGTGQYCLNWLASFASAHRKQIALPEWGVGDRSDGHGVGDSPVIMTNMLAWIAAHDVAYTCYWDYNAGDYNSMVSSGERPNEGAVLKSWFQHR